MLIVRKLYRYKYWGGAHNKNFIWGDDIANGRGVDPVFKDIAKDVANFLRLKGINSCNEVRLRERQEEIKGAEIRSKRGTYGRYCETR